MKNGKYCIAIMSVGSGVGQSVITSCNLSKLPLFTVGFDINPFAFGAYDCDAFEMIPRITSNGYIPELIRKCQKHSIDLIIPGLDGEALLLSQHQKAFNDQGIKIITADEPLIAMVREKERMCQDLSQYADIFVESYTLSEAKKLAKENKIKFPLIAKPRGGSGSAEIIILLDDHDFDKVSELQIVQEIAVPQLGDPNRESFLESIKRGRNLQVSEISIQLLAGQKGQIIGKMMSFNKLKFGVPTEISPYVDDYIWSQIDLIMPKLKELGHKGPLNIQGRMTDSGFKVFEMNARFTGISGLRAVMGFNEVEACIREWLKLEAAETININLNRFGTRQVIEKSLRYETKFQQSILPYMIKDQIGKIPKTIMVTGANGYLGREVVENLSQKGFQIFALGRNMNKLKEMFGHNERVTCVTVDELINGDFSLGHVDYLVHCAFARPHRSFSEIAESLNFTNFLFSRAAQMQLPAIINISSQSLYGSNHLTAWSESDQVSPESPYSQAKYASELMLNSIFATNHHFCGTSIRLATLSGGKKHVSENELVFKLIKRVINHEKIEILDGSQQIERLDVRDAASAIKALIKMDNHKWQRVYNICPEKTYTLAELVDQIVAIGKDKFGLDATVLTKKADNQKSAGMNGDLFKNDANWQAEHGLKTMIEDIYTYYLNSEKS
ncbi:NAD-dependent epimerase/dehydratase family protein [Eubacteriaceae bacterium ES2]|nr:NAD-dependent epimerase/dehydratase family protein [Eubacteriaceae bacterium ES2]